MVESTRLQQQLGSQMCKTHAHTNIFWLPFLRFFCCFFFFYVQFAHIYSSKFSKSPERERAQKIVFLLCMTIDRMTISRRNSIERIQNIVSFLSDNFQAEMIIAGSAWTRRKKVHSNQVRKWKSEGEKKKPEITHKYCIIDCQKEKMKAIHILYMQTCASAPFEYFSFFSDFIVVQNEISHFLYVSYSFPSSSSATFRFDVCRAFLSVSSLVFFSGSISFSRWLDIAIDALWFCGFNHFFVACLL